MGFMGLPDAGRLRRKMKPIDISEDIHRHYNFETILKQWKKMHEIHRNWRSSFQQVLAGRVRSGLGYHAWIPVPAKTHRKSPKFSASNFWALLSLTIEERRTTWSTSDWLRQSDTFAPRGFSACCRSSYIRSVCPEPSTGRLWVLGTRHLAWLWCFILTVSYCISYVMNETEIHVSTIHSDTDPGYGAYVGILL